MEMESGDRTGSQEQPVSGPSQAPAACCCMELLQALTVPSSWGKPWAANCMSSSMQLTGDLQLGWPTASMLAWMSAFAHALLQQA